MDEDLSIINTNTRNEKIKSFSQLRRSALLKKKDFAKIKDNDIISDNPLSSKNSK